MPFSVGWLFRNTIQDLEHPAGPFPAGNALAAGFFGGELLGLADDLNHKTTLAINRGFDCSSTAGKRIVSIRQTGAVCGGALHIAEDGDARFEAGEPFQPRAPPLA